MDGRGWPWKRKSSDKATIEKPVVGNESTAVCSLSYLASLENQDKCKNTNYVQITMDSYTHMSKMEDQVKLFETEVKDLKEKLTIAHSEIKTKESSILQHAKVAEEAVSGWEKADAETLALKRQLESVTLLKVTAEDRASHLDDALKECTRQIRIVKDESDQKLQDVIIAKTIHWDKIRSELEGKIDELSQGLHRAASDNAVLTRSLQERSEMIIRISEERSKAEADVEKLKTNIQLAEKEISSLKYDVHVASKEVEIRNEEKNMSLKSAEIANKQHLEAVKKIVKLEAECQRLRGLLRKKLPGPAALAQMKIEVESLGHEFTDPRAQRITAQNPNHINAHMAKPELSPDHKWEDCKRENVHLTRHTLEMEEEIQTLKELLASRNNELQVSRNVCAKTLGKLKILEGQLHMVNNEKNASKSNSRNLSESPSSGHDHNYPPSVTSVSEDGFDEEGSSSEYGLVNSTDSHKVRKTNVDDSSKPRISNKLELMDDFLEIEKLAADEPNEATSASKSSNSEDTTTLNQVLKVLHTRINKLYESQEGINIEKIVEAARLTIHEMQGSSLSHLLFEVGNETQEKHVLSSQDTENLQENTKKQDLEAAVSNIYNFIKSTTKESTQLQESLENFSSSVSKLSLSDLIIELSRLSVLANNSAKCINKVTLLEKENIALELSRCLQDLESTKARLEEKDQIISKLEDLQSMTETQLKCVTESYKSLELSSKDLEAKVKSLEEEKQTHEETLVKYKDLQSKFQPNQEKEIEKLAACQETIHLLSQQLQSLQLQTKISEAKPNSAEEEEDDNIIIQQSNSFRHKMNPTVQTIIKSSSVSSSSKEDNEKLTRGFGRFFSKSKNNGR